MPAQTARGASHCPEAGLPLKSVGLVDRGKLSILERLMSQPRKLLSTAPEEHTVGGRASDEERQMAGTTLPAFVGLRTMRERCLPHQRGTSFSPLVMPRQQQG